MSYARKIVLHCLCGPTMALEDDRDCFMLTSSHPDESVDDAIRFARSLTGECEGEVQLVELK